MKVSIDVNPSILAAAFSMDPQALCSMLRALCEAQDDEDEREEFSAAFVAAVQEVAQDHGPSELPPLEQLLGRLLGAVRAEHRAWMRQIEGEG